MLCELCQSEAVGRCRACGVAYCADHGGSYCYRCSAAVTAAEPGKIRRGTGVVSGDRDPRPSGKGYLQCPTTERPTIHLEDPGPPACRLCGALARKVCRNCHGLFCPEHGKGELCLDCLRSSRLGLIILGVMFALVAGPALFFWLAGKF
jgi:hypothetical protein